METRSIDVELDKAKVRDGSNPYDLIEDQLVPWRYGLWQEGFNVEKMDVEILDQTGKQFEMDVVNVRITAHLTPAPKEN